MRKTGHFHQKVATKRTKTPDRRANILDMECDNLADQVLSFNPMAIFKG